MVPVITASTSSARPAAAGASGCVAKRAMEEVGRTSVRRNCPSRVISASARPMPRLSSVATGFRNVNGRTASERISPRPGGGTFELPTPRETSTVALKR